MKPVRLMLIDAADSTPPYLPLELLPDGQDTLIEHAATERAIELTLRWLEPDVVLSEFGVATPQGRQALDLVQRLRPDIPLILLSDEHDEQLEIEALHRGSFDCVPKHDKARLLAVLTHALSVTRERRFRAQIERAWQESELRFRLFMEHMPGAAYTKDLAGRFTYVNSVAKRVIGLPAGEIIGKTLHQLYPSEVADSLAANDDRALKVRQPIEAMERVDTPDGPRVFRSIKFPIIGMDGQATMTGGFSVDMTEADSTLQPLPHDQHTGEP
ncbi:MAG TPA: PAS domain-containing protein [Burkholderiaceae bacterium]|nr:PAS domain-containing protein [Burkholderiaceae bacterium]